VHLVGYFHNCITMHGVMNVKRKFRNEETGIRLMPAGQINCKFTLYKMCV
jgi:hypothetical protein